MDYQFVMLVAAMRRAQVECLKEISACKIKTAQRLEREVDEAVAKIRKEYGSASAR